MRIYKIVTTGFFLIAITPTAFARPDIGAGFERDRSGRNTASEHKDNISTSESSLAHTHCEVKNTIELESRSRRVRVDHSQKGL